MLKTTVMLTKVFTRVTFSNVMKFKNYFPNLDFCEVANWLRWRWESAHPFTSIVVPQAITQLLRPTAMVGFLHCKIARTLLLCFCNGRSCCWRSLRWPTAAFLWRAVALLHSLRWGCATALKLCVCLRASSATSSCRQRCSLGRGRGGGAGSDFLGQGDGQSGTVWRPA